VSFRTFFGLLRLLFFVLVFVGIAAYLDLPHYTAILAVILGILAYWLTGRKHS
jgi:hypothetical protein